MNRYAPWIAACVAALTGCGAGASDDAPEAQPQAVCSDAPAPRQLAPMSTSTTTSRRPTLRWQPPPAAILSFVEVCRDAACARAEQVLVAAGGRVRPPRALAAGVHFWRVLTLRHARGPCALTVSGTWEFFVRHRSAPIDTSWGTVADFNRDGLPDLAVGAPQAGPGEDEPVGEVYVYYGRVGGLHAAPDQTLTLTGTGVRFAGDAVAPAGDVNGDGYGDLVVGNRLAADDDGLAWVFHGGPAGLSATPATSMPGPESGFFGEAVAGLGDVNGDGYGDVAVGAPSFNNARGAVQVHLGGPAGVGAAPSMTLLPPVADEGAFGAELLVAGDVNGDGYADLGVGAPEARTLGLQTGRGLVYLGSAAGLPAAPSTVIASPMASGLHFGDHAAGVGDLNGDGYADLAFGLPIARGDNGIAYVYFGGAAGVAAAPSETIESPTTPEAGFGGALAAAGDVNGDGYDDLLASTSPTLPGDLVHVFHGGPAGVPLAPDVTIPSPAPMGARFGSALAGAGDLDADGYDDVVVGAPYEGTFDGRVYLYRGGAASLALTPFASLDAPDGGLFGTALAGRR